MDHLSIAPERPVPGPPAAAPPPEGPPPGGPLRTTSSDDLGRSRLTVAFRLVLAIPHLVWLTLWSGVMVLLSPVLWVATLVRRRPPDGLREVYELWIRYTLHVYAYLHLAANPYPAFLGRPRSYPIDLEVPPAVDQSRWTVGFRLFLALPPFVLATALVGGGVSGGSSTDPSQPESFAVNVGIAASVAFLAWWACVIRGRMPQGFRDLLLWALGYYAQVGGYLFLLTPAYPNSDPALAPLAALPEHPVRLRLTDELRRNRLTVAFRLILAVPHLVWLTLWSVPALLAALLSWLVTLVRGRAPGALHRFLAAYIRYASHVVAFTYLAGGPFPGFVGRQGSYPVDVEIDAPERQSRWATLFRLVLAVPALIVASAVGTAMLFAAAGGWFASLFTGRMPEGLRNVIAFGVRYSAQGYAYLFLVTGRYPYSGPADFRR